MTDILNQIDDTLTHVRKSMEKNAERFDPFGPGPDLRNKSGIEEEAAVPEPGPLLTLADVAATAFEMRRRTPEDRQAYLAEQRARHVAHGAPEAWLACFDALSAGGDVTIMPADQFDEFMATIDAPDDAPALRAIHERRHPTLAEMNAASAAVRARRADPVDEQEGEQDEAEPWVCSMCGHTVSPGAQICVGCNQIAEEEKAEMLASARPWWRRMLGGTR